MSDEPVAMFLRHKLGEEEGTKTFKRWYQWLTDVFHKPTSEEIGEVFRAIEESDYDELIVIRGLDVDLVCPHHILPVPMIVSVGYMPRGKILGLSKFGRAARMLGTAKLQEDYTEELAKLLAERLGSHWLMVVATAEHACMRCRGVKAKFSDVMTSKIIYTDATGNKLNKSDNFSKGLKQEFLKALEMRKIP